MESHLFPQVLWSKTRRADSAARTSQLCRDNEWASPTANPASGSELNRRCTGMPLPKSPGLDSQDDFRWRLRTGDG